MLAEITFVGVDMGAAIAACEAFPARKLDIGLPLGVSAKQSSHNEKEVAESALIESGFDRGASLSLAEPFVLDMGMRHSIVGAGRIRRQGDDPVRRPFGQFAPFQPNFKRAEFCSAQRDRVGGRRNGSRFEINEDFFELVV